ncbi:hypothetical protein HMPREF0663_10757 [Hoylesella oralis ATCC 33269]|uniref:Uncharacterized protein n=1 Tax=Hoylesella oralis ATCC 33269 TaxID=873533 RepID=E7RNK6_9BACT|nr:hypothetical protein HMPREF0663_10757 [Hoylesella oralis ATCC 33269]
MPRGSRKDDEDDNLPQPLQRRGVLCGSRKDDEDDNLPLPLQRRGVPFGRRIDVLVPWRVKYLRWEQTIRLLGIDAPFESVKHII